MPPGIPSCTPAGSALLSDLPSEVLAHIFDHLSDSPAAIAAAMSICKSFQSNELWQLTAALRFPWLQAYSAQIGHTASFRQMYNAQVRAAFVSPAQLRLHRHVPEDFRECPTFKVTEWSLGHERRKPRRRLNEYTAVLEFYRVDGGGDDATAWVLRRMDKLYDRGVPVSRLQHHPTHGAHEAWTRTLFARDSGTVDTRAQVRCRCFLLRARGQVVQIVRFFDTRCASGGGEVWRWQPNAIAANVSSLGDMKIEEALRVRDALMRGFARQRPYHLSFSTVHWSMFLRLMNIVDCSISGAPALNVLVLAWFLKAATEDFSEPDGNLRARHSQRLSHEMVVRYLEALLPWS